MINNHLKFFLKVLLFVLVGWLLCNLFPASLGIVDVQAKNSTVTPNKISFMKDGETTYQTFDVTGFHSTSYPDIQFYGYFEVVHWAWKSVKFNVPNSYSGDFDLSFIYTGNWMISDDNPLTFAIKQGNNIFPCDNTNVWNTQDPKDLTNVYCPNVSLTNNSFQVILAFKKATKTTIEKDSVGITPINLFSSGFSSLEQQQKETQAILKDSSIDENINIKQDDLTDDSGLQDLLFMPLTLMNAINTGFNSSCSSFSLGSLFGHNIELRCFTISDIIGLDLAGIIDVIISGIFIYLFSKHLRKVFDKTTNLESEEGDVI